MRKATGLILTAAMFCGCTSAPSEPSPDPAEGDMEMADAEFIADAEYGRLTLSWE